MPHWFDNAFPLYLAPMAGVTDVVFREICKELGADVMVTEFVSAEGIIRRDDRTRKYTEFSDGQRPLGVQLFGANGDNMAEAALKIIDWKQPDFIDLNFGCPVNKVVSKNGGSSLLKDCPTLTKVAGTVARKLPIPVTAKIRIGWDEKSINAPSVVRMLEDCGIAAIAIHGRTRSQGYSGKANWEVIAECAEAVSIPVIGNGDIESGQDIERYRNETGVSGVMIGRTAMRHPWIFQEAKHYLKTGHHPDPIDLETRWNLMVRHCRMTIESGRFTEEIYAMQAMRSRLMAYSKGLPNGKMLRSKFCHVSSITELEDLAAEYLAFARDRSAA